MMEELFMDVNWLATLVGAVGAYALGALWYSPTMFAKAWMAGRGGGLVDHGMMLPMVTQAVGTFLLAWVVGITETTDSLAFAILITLMVATLIKANGLFAGKTKVAIAIEASFVVAMVVVMVLVHAIL